jgi:cytidylate kinase
MGALNDEGPFLRRLIVAIDGPAGSGKTTTARGVAKALGLRHVDTGAMYRAVTWKTLQTGTDASDETRVAEIARTIDIEFAREGTGAEKVAADGADVSDAIRTVEVTRHVSLVSSYPAVRKSMVRIQRHLAREGGVVLEGRDIGSVVLPGAHVKVFLQASVDERARRRARELAAKGVEKSVEEIREDIERRDRFDSTRETSPLKVAVGAHVVDTTALTIDEEVRRIVDIARDTAAFLASRSIPRGEKTPRAARRPVYGATCDLIRLAAKALFGLRVTGRDGPDLAENYIYAANHRSNADPPIVGATLSREVHILAKVNLFEKPAFGKLIRYYNAIPTRRDVFDREAFGRAAKVLAGGGSLLIFPEGTRSRTDGFGDPKPGVGYLALTTGVPVLPVYARGTGKLKDSFWRRGRLTVVFGDPIRVPNPDTAQPTPENCREFSRMVMAAIESLRDEVEAGTS